jgi:hypothetical protein
VKTYGIPRPYWPPNSIDDSETPLPSRQIPKRQRDVVFSNTCTDAVTQVRPWESTSFDTASATSPDVTSLMCKFGSIVYDKGSLWCCMQSDCPSPARTQSLRSCLFRSCSNLIIVCRGHRGHPRQLNSALRSPHRSYPLLGIASQLLSNLKVASSLLLDFI